jgi:hypothetical protein
MKKGHLRKEITDQINDPDFGQILEEWINNIEQEVKSIASELDAIGLNSIPPSIEGNISNAMAAAEELADGLW